MSLVIDIEVVPEAGLLDLFLRLVLLEAYYIWHRRLFPALAHRQGHCTAPVNGRAGSRVLLEGHALRYGGAPRFFDGWLELYAV